MLVYFITKIHTKNSRFFFISICDNGIVSIIDTNKFCEEFSYTPHEYSVWCSMFDKTNINVVYSGADDGKFCAFDTLSNKSTFKKKVGVHDAGICHIISNECDLSQNTMFLGSFDEY